MATVQRARAVLRLKKNNTVSVTGRAKAARDGLLSDPKKFAGVSVTPADIDAQITKVDQAEAVARTKAVGSASARNVQRGLLVGMLEKVLTGVQGIADASATYADAVATIEQAGLSVAKRPQRNKQILNVKQGPQQGSAILEAFAKMLGAAGRRKCFFNWQQTSDGKTFTNLPSTPKATTSVNGLTPLNTYGFRVSVTNSDGVQGEWSQIVNFLVH